LWGAYEAAYADYEHLIHIGVAKEVARLVLPVGLNSSMWATCNARSLMSFLSLRTYEPESMFPSKPQYEIEQVARLMEHAFAEHMPITYEAWNNNGRVAP
jgi:thymidylate synthase (FAD)